jgi:hypothetical protein
MNAKEAISALETLTSNQGFSGDLNTIDDHIAKAIGVVTPLGREALSVALANVLLLDKEQNLTPDTVKSFGLFGIVVHMNEDFERLKRAFSSRRKRAKMHDTFRSLFNYSLVATLIESGKWPK